MMSEKPSKQQGNGVKRKRGQGKRGQVGNGVSP